MSKDPEPIPEVDPRELLRQMLWISPEDAERVRESTPPARRQPKPSSDSGDSEG